MLILFKIYSMRSVFNKFLVIKVIIYTLAFSLLWYLYYTKVSPTPSWEQQMTIGIEDRQIVCIEDHCFDSEIADSEQEREQWLMNRTYLSTQSGMLFVFPQEGKYSFWMKNTLIPLDMIWIDHHGRVVDIQTAQPCDSDPCPSYIPSHSGLYVLEVNAWISKLLWLQTWSIAHISKE